MFSSDDDNQGVVLGMLFGVVLLVIGFVIGIAIHKSHAKVDKPVVVEAVVVDSDVASVKVENGVVKFYFAEAKFEVAAGAGESLADVVKGVAEGKQALVSGFHDATGDMAKNEELAKLRALAVRDALKVLGVAEDKIEMNKPEAMIGTGNNAEARRVEVSLQ